MNPNSNGIVFEYNLKSLGLGTIAIDSFFSSFSEQIYKNLDLNIKFVDSGSVSDFSIVTSIDNSLFSSNSVAAITQISYDNFGEIIAAKIIINLNNPVSSDPSDYNYFGNIIAHEIGHSIGLDHSTAWASTMTPYLNPGQYTWESDDIIGALHILGKTKGSRGEIFGVFVGGNESKRIYGVVVDLIDIETMSVVQSKISNKRGEFTFSNVDKSKKYFIFYGPFNFNSSFQNEYLSTYNNFCYGNSSYEYTSLTSCLNTENDGPQIVFFDNTEKIDLGEIGIKCDLNTSDILYDYFINSGSETILIDDTILNDSIFLNGIVADEREITIPLSLQITEPGEFLNIILISQILRSPMVLSGTIMDLDSNIGVSFGDKKISNFQGLNIPVSEGLPDYNYNELLELKVGENNFELKLKSTEINSIINNLDSKYSERNFYFSPGSKIGSFILTLRIGKLGNDGTFVPNSKLNTSASSNDFSCSSALNSFEASDSASPLIKSSGIISSGGCSAVASETSRNSGFGLFYFLIELFFYIVFYTATRRLFIGS